MKRFRNALLVIVGLQACAVVVRTLQLRAPANPPAVDLTGYPQVTRDAVEQRLATHDPRDAESWKSLADVLFACGKYSEAEACYREATGLQPTSARYTYDLAFCLSTMGRLTDSDTFFRRTQELDPAVAADCQYQLGCNALRALRGDAAEGALTKADDDASRLRLAALRIHQRKYSVAESTLQTVLRTHPQSYVAHQLLTEIFRLTDRPELARSQAGLADLLNEVIPSAWHRQAEPLVAISKTIGAEGFARAAADRVARGDLSAVQKELEASQVVLWDPRSADVLTQILQRSDPAVARQALEELIQRDGATVSRLARLGQILQTIDEDSAVAVAASALPLLPVSSVHDSAMLVDLIAGLKSDAAQRAEFMAAHDRQQGFEFLSRLQLEQTIKAFESSLDVNDRQPEIWFLLGRIRQLTENQEAAESAFRHCLELEPTHRNAQHFLAALNRNDK